MSQMPAQFINFQQQMFCFPNELFNLCFLWWAANFVEKTGIPGYFPMCLGLMHKLAQGNRIFLGECLRLVQVDVNVLIVPSSVLLNSIC